MLCFLFGVFGNMQERRGKFIFFLAWAKRAFSFAVAYHLSVILEVC
jgi:hypothetical protein